MTGHAIVTGSSGGIGSAVCRLLAADGWTVTGLDLQAPASDSGHEHITVDLAAEGAAAAAIAEANAAGPVSALVHCAAVQAIGSAGSADRPTWWRTLAVNLVALDELVGACRADLIEARGSVVAVSSVHAHATTRDIAVYATSKAALEGWVRAAALDLAPQVRVNAVRPGAVNTEMLAAGLVRRPEDGAPEDALTELAARTPLNLVAEPAAIASVVVVLLDPRVNRFLTGSVVTADGGALSKLSTE